METNIETPNAVGVHQPFYKVLYFQVLAAIIGGALVGFLFPDFGASL